MTSYYDKGDSVQCGVALSRIGAMLVLVFNVETRSFFRIEHNGRI